VQKTPKIIRNITTWLTQLKHRLTWHCEQQHVEVTVCTGENARETEAKNSCSGDGGSFQEYDWQGRFLRIM